jgi:hypothetical protein
LVGTLLILAAIAPLDHRFSILFYFYYFQMCGVSLVSSGDGGAPDALLLVHAAAFISACRIEPQVPPTASRAKHAVWLCSAPLLTPPDLGLGRAGNVRLG